MSRLILGPSSEAKKTGDVHLFAEPGALEAYEKARAGQDTLAADEAMDFAERISALLKNGSRKD